MGSEYQDKFMDLYNKMHDPNNGYFNKLGIPYHSANGIVVEAPDHSKQSTSEAMSYYLWNEAVYGKLTGNWENYVKAWGIMEKYFIPSEQLQASSKDYQPSHPASYSPEMDDPSKYPTQMDQGKSSSDPIYDELNKKHGSSVYDMHWLMDVDNWYGLGEGTDPVLINTYQRGSRESVWKAIPQPCVEEFKYGTSNGGFLPIFTQDSQYSKQAKWTQAPDASTRAVVSLYFAMIWSQKNLKIMDLIPKGAKMMDWGKYATFDKYFKSIGCQDKKSTCNDMSSCHYLLSWYYSWGNPIVSNNWAFKIGASYSHQGYQNPLASYVASQTPEFTQSMTQSAPDHWQKSTKRQIQFYRWLQSQEGAIAGGCNNSFNGDYSPYPSGVSKFFNMVYTESPAFLLPLSNVWIGFQSWSFERVLHYLYYSKDTSVEPMADKWIQWITSNIKQDPQLGTVIPSSISWTGQPDSDFNDDSSMPPDNINLHVQVTQYGQDVGIMSSIARCLMYYSIYKNDSKYQQKAKDLLDFVLNNSKTDIGYSFLEERPDYSNFNTDVYIPPDYNGVMPNGDKLVNGQTFIGIRSKYLQDPEWPNIKKCIDNNQVYSYKYHRYWMQSELLIAMGTYDILFNPQPTPEVAQSPVSPPPIPPTPAPTTGNTGSVPSSNCKCNPCKCVGCDSTPTTKTATMPPGGVVTTPGNSNADLSKSEFELKVIGSKLTLKGQEFILKGINWFGFETGGQCVEGLTTHTLDWYLDLLQNNKFNAIRLPYAWDLAKDMDKITPSEKLIDYTINPDLKGLTSGQIMDLLIKKAGDRGILIMLDMHRINGANNTIPELWYSAEAPETDIISVWKAMATRYKDQYQVFAYDLKNEGHDSIEVGTGSDKDLWAYFGRVGNELLKINPKALIFCEGYDKYVNKDKQIWNYPGWGATIRVLQDGHKVDLSNPSKLVYSTHNYPKSVSGTEGNMTEDKLHDNFGFAVEKGIAAVVPGEWSCKSDGPDADWMSLYVKYLKKIQSFSQFHWTLNPTSGDTGGYLNSDWTTVDPLKQKVLEDLIQNPPKISVNGDTLQVQNLGAKITKAVVQEATQSQNNVSITPSPANGPSVEQKKTNEWTSGPDTIQQFDVVITNTTSSTLQSLVLQASNQSSIKQLWNMQQGDGNTYTLPSWKTSFAPKESYTFGFQSLKTPLAEFSLKSFQ